MSSEGSDKSANPSNGANALLGDLESIRTLLSEEDEAARGREHQTAADETGTDAPVPTRAEASAPGTATSGGAEDEAIASGDDEVPLLEDVVSGSLGIDDLAVTTDRIAIRFPGRSFTLE